MIGAIYIRYLPRLREFGLILNRMLRRRCIWGRILLTLYAYRIVSNCGKNACQSVMHLHLHILGGTLMSGRMA